MKFYNVSHVCRIDESVEMQNRVDAQEDYIVHNLGRGLWRVEEFFSYDTPQGWVEELGKPKFFRTSELQRFFAPRYEESVEVFKETVYR